MIRVWIWVFTPATVAAVAGLGFLAYAALSPGLYEVLAGIVIAIGLLGWYRLFRPVLGTED